MCENCKKTIQLPEFSNIPENHKLIELRSKGNLLHPSVQLYDLISILESCIIQVTGNEDVTADTLFRITAALEEISPLPLIGCEKHNIIFTRRIIIFYLTTRMHFICKQINKNESEQKTKTKEKRKAAKLVVKPAQKKTKTDENNIGMSTHSKTTAVQRQRMILRDINM